MASWENSNKLRQRSLKESDLKSREASAKILCANLVQFWKRDPKGTFGILRSKTWYANNRVELGPYVTQKSMIGFLEFLIERKVVELNTNLEAASFEVRTKTLFRSLCRKLYIRVRHLLLKIVSHSCCCFHPIRGSYVKPHMGQYFIF